MMTCELHKKALHVAMHPKGDVAAVATGSKFYIYQQSPLAVDQKGGITAPGVGYMAALRCFTCLTCLPAGTTSLLVLFIIAFGRGWRPS